MEGEGGFSVICGFILVFYLSISIIISDFQGLWFIGGGS